MLEGARALEPAEIARGETWPFRLKEPSRPIWVRKRLMTVRMCLYAARPT